MYEYSGERDSEHGMHGIESSTFSDKRDTLTSTLSGNDNFTNTFRSTEGNGQIFQQHLFRYYYFELFISFNLECIAIFF